ncbi:MAG TPA: HEAT repeat domain-containing protein [Polyangia bacterium]|nr:HEAT repeat domain-containing protein [Polyangia bacterium]
MAGAIIHITVLLAGLVAADAGAPSNDHAKAPTRAEVESALAKGGAPGELQHWAATADGILTTVAADRAASETVRARALSALAYARTSRVHAFLENFIIEKTPSSTPVDRVLLRRAAASLGWQGGARVVEVLGPLLDHSDAEVRLDAAAALGLSRSREAEGPLRARLTLETDAAVRRQIEAALKAVTTTR